MHAKKTSGYVGPYLKLGLGLLKISLHYAQMQAIGQCALTCVNVLHLLHTSEYFSSRELCPGRGSRWIKPDDSYSWERWGFKVLEI